MGTSKVLFATPDKKSSMNTLWQEEQFEQIGSVGSVGGRANRLLARVCVVPLPLSTLNVG